MLLFLWIGTSWWPFSHNRKILLDSFQKFPRSRNRADDNFSHTAWFMFPFVLCFVPENRQSYHSVVRPTTRKTRRISRLDPRPKRVGCRVFFHPIRTKQWIQRKKTTATDTRQFLSDVSDNVLHLRHGIYSNPYSVGGSQPF